MILINSAALEASVKNFVRELRNEFDAINLPNLRFDIEVSGRVQGEMKIEFVLGDQYGSDSVRGGSINAVVEEYLRRRGWKQRHAPLSLTFDNDDTAFPNTSAAE